ncbi:hypothetical protein NM688_g4552 [Phlebia brevispora]|uniref:Uncharacterized protein n=1 Tax=Phlebia brevispora TaxID=194682 RepID=A0ACC1T2J0_9APHY|nr:hypothetical protein NM688_g4552 [Phlebia brevispora]
MAYQSYTSNTTLGQITNWHALLEQGVDSTTIFTSEESRNNFHQMLENASRAIIEHMAGYTNEQIASLNAHVASIEKETADLQATMRHLAELKPATQYMAIYFNNVKEEKDLDEYLDLLLKVYKAIYSDKSYASVFGTSSSNDSSKDSDAMEIDTQAKSKGKGKEHQANSTETKKKHCLICAAKRLKKKAQLHNTENCYDKPGNESKQPASKPTPALTAHNHSDGKQAQLKKSFKAQLMELIESLDSDEEDTATPTGLLHINTLGDKDMMIGYSYLYKHNLKIDWQKGQWEFTKCSETCTARTCKTHSIEARIDELQLEPDLLWESSLNNLGDEDKDNAYIN